MGFPHFKTGPGRGLIAEAGKRCDLCIGRGMARSGTPRGPRNVQQRDPFRRRLWKTSSVAASDRLNVRASRMIENGANARLGPPYLMNRSAAQFEASAKRNRASPHRESFLVFLRANVHAIVAHMTRLALLPTSLFACLVAGVFGLTLVAAATARAQSIPVETAMARDPAPAPGPAFPDIPEVDMTRLCPSLGSNVRFYPERARDMDRTGQVVLDCAFGADGKAQSCQVLYENPAGFDFGAAATKIACYYRLGPPVSAPQPHQLLIPVPPSSHLYHRDGDGEPLRLRATINFNLAG